MIWCWTRRLTWRSTRRLTRRWPTLLASWWFRSFGNLSGKIQMTKDISYVKYVERYSLQLQTCASISSPPWGETINWPQLVLIVAPVSIGKTQDGAHWWSNKKVFQCVLMLFPLSSMNTLFTWVFLLC